MRLSELMKQSHFPFRRHLLSFLFIYLSIFHCSFSDATVVNILHAAGLHACNVAKANRDEDPMPKQL